MSHECQSIRAGDCLPRSPGFPRRARGPHSPSLPYSVSTRRVLGSSVTFQNSGKGSAGSDPVDPVPSSDSHTASASQTPATQHPQHTAPQHTTHSTHTTRNTAPTAHKTQHPQHTAPTAHRHSTLSIQHPHHTAHSTHSTWHTAPTAHSTHNTHSNTKKGTWVTKGTLVTILPPKLSLWGRCSDRDTQTDSNILEKAGLKSTRGPHPGNPAGRGGIVARSIMWQVKPLPGMPTCSAAHPAPCYWPWKGSGRS